MGGLRAPFPFDLEWAVWYNSYMANRDPHAGPVVFKLPTLDPKVIPVIHRRYPDFVGKVFDAHYQVSYFGHGYADVVKVDGLWKGIVYFPGGKYRCTAGSHKKHKDAMAVATDLLLRYKVPA